MPLAFCTVGTTRFDDLISTVTSDAVLQMLHERYGITELVVQYGRGSKVAAGMRGEVKVSGFDFKPSLKEDMAAARIIITHAGAGSLVESLRLDKSVVAVVNTSLMDNHQEELGSALQDKGYLVMAPRAEALCATLGAADFSKRVPFPGQDASRFAALVSDEMGIS
jgi:beta-1,4-N-acetylglucosaminyltransferase